MGRAAAQERGEQPGDPLGAFCLAVAEDLAMLACLHDREPDAPFIGMLKSLRFPEGLGLVLKGEPGRQAADLMRQALEALPERPGQPILDEMAVDYTSIYLTHGIQASPEESVWIDEEHLICQESMFQVRKCYERHGLAAPDWRVRPDDHLVLELQFLSHLFQAPPGKTAVKEIARFMDEHLLRWLGRFSSRVAQHCATPYFAGCALLTSSYCEELRDLLAQILDEPRPTQEEIDARMKPVAMQEQVPVSFVPGVGPAV
jgi:TorA maturation chaperone TorD